MDENSPSEVEISRFDRRILGLYADGKSLEEIAATVPGEQTEAMLAFRIKQMLAKQSSLLNSAEQAALHLYDLKRLKAKVWKMLDGEDGNRAITGLANIMQQIGDRIDLAASASDARMSAIRAGQAREFAAALEMMYDRVSQRLSAEYPDVDPMVLREMMGEEFGRAVARIDKLVETEED